MSAKTNAEVVIGGKVYTLSGFESEEYLQKIASYINTKISEAEELDSFKHLTPDMRAILTELNIADDYFKAKAQVEKLELDLEAKEREIYNLKHDLISNQVQTETNTQRIEELEAENKELLLNKTKLEAALEDSLLGKVTSAKTDKKEELVEKLVFVNRVAKTVKGGRTMSFAALVVVGDQKGRIGFGSGKAAEVPEAIVKATNEAKKNMIRIPLREGRTLHHDISGRFGAGKVVLRTAPAGTGVIAGGPMRAVFEVLGVQDVVAKSLGSNNPYNMIKATFAALQAINSPRMVAAKRGKKVGDIVSRRENTSNVKMDKEEA